MKMTVATITRRTVKLTAAEVEEAVMLYVAEKTNDHLWHPETMAEQRNVNVELTFGENHSIELIRNVSGDPKEEPVS